MVTHSEIDEAGKKCDNFYIENDGSIKWCKIKLPVNVRTRLHNIITYLPGPKREVRRNKTPLH